MPLGDGEVLSGTPAVQEPAVSSGQPATLYRQQEQQEQQEQQQ
jgi:hypothetical protein